MTNDSVTIAPSTIAGGQNADLTKFILSSDDLLQESYYRLYGYYKEIGEPSANGQATIIWKKDEKLAYNQACIAWMDSKLSQILNKDQKLSNYKTILEMNNEGYIMVEGFIYELASQLKKFEIKDPEKLIVLVNLYSNFVATAIRHALEGDDKAFLTKTTSETTQKIQQVINEQSQKGGGVLGKLPLIGGLFGG